MRLFLFIGFISINIYCQNSSINCDSLIYEVHYGCLTVEKMPELIGGLNSLQSRLIYPKDAIDNQIEGKVYVWIVVDSTGSQFCATVIKSLGYGYDEEALKLVKSSQFLPGILKRKPYTMPVLIPIIFSLTDKK